MLVAVQSLCLAIYTLFNSYHGDQSILSCTAGRYPLVLCLILATSTQPANEVKVQCALPWGLPRSTPCMRLEVMGDANFACFNEAHFE